ncbi:50S ribosomal protein L17 [Patescibacteria group bacterium]|nr:50S ribosomal protein L17 [Patescibacteria group bacterium]MBU1672836.1 50S ribosomal protein L17 [Patescibacteria group bacterium]MBU1963266.1 50S ribosomal protein L17 [Patescibacteria group bacterium]
MRHQKRKKTLGRERGQRKALLVSLSNNLIQKGRITTTEPKAKFIRPIVEKMVTKAGKNTLAQKRELMKALNNEGSVKILMEKLGPKYKDRNGGYLRIIKAGQRKGDNAKLAIIEFV